MITFLTSLVLGFHLLCTLRLKVIPTRQIRQVVLDFFDELDSRVIEFRFIVFMLFSVVQVAIVMASLIPPHALVTYSTIKKLMSRYRVDV